MKIALVQMEIIEKNKEANLRHGLELLRRAVVDHDVVVMPEIWTTGYSLGRLQQEAEAMDGSLVAELCQLAAASRCSILAGSVPMLKEGKIYNTALAINRQGRLVHAYDKVHLFGLFREEEFFAPGNNFSTFDLDGVCCGTTICYDLRFPELYRHLALQGAQIIFCPAEWPEARGDIWRLLVQARAAEDHIFLVAVNCAGSFKKAPFYGHSLVVGPDGKIIVEAGEGEEILSCELDLDNITRVRTRLNALADVRKELIQ